MSANRPVVSLKDRQSERLGEEITELYAQSALIVSIADKRSRTDL